MRHNWDLSQCKLLASSVCAHAVDHYQLKILKPSDAWRCFLPRTAHLQLLRGHATSLDQIQLLHLRRLGEHV